jgi:glutamate/tyrosine decarboxylase-like PLP-dependent enzyme
MTATNDKVATAPGAFEWHPEPELIGITDADASRAALELLGRRTWTEALDYLYDHALQRAMGVPVGYEAVRELFFGPGGRPAPAPAEPTTSDHLLAEFRTRIAPHNLNSWHPRALSYFTPPPLVASIVGEVLAQWTNQGVDVWHAGPIAAFVEEEVVRWLCDLVGYDDRSFGILASGGVMANFIAMAIARDVHVPRITGAAEAPRGRALEGLRVYTSDQTHFSIGRALDELGFPRDTLVVLPSDDAFRLHAEPVAAAIARDRADGRTPIAIAAVAGSTNTGSVDLVPELAEVARREGLWLHVDAAYGGAARLSGRDAGRVPGLELADSVTVDPHKWFFQAYDIGGLLVRDGTALGRAFGGRRPEYYRGAEGRGTNPDVELEHDDHDGQLNFYKLGFEGTRRWRALKLWLSWKHLGTRGFGRLIERTDDIAAYLATCCAASDHFEAVPAAPELSVVCFRHLAPGLDGATLDRHQDALAAALEASGDGWLSTTSLRGRTYLRAGVVNYLTTNADIDHLLARLCELGDGLPV